MSEAKERPILFKAEMVQAILEGRKTQTRRIVKFPDHTYQPDAEWVQSVHQDGGGNWIAWSCDYPELAEFAKEAYPNGEGFACPYGAVGDRLWVRETWGTSPFTSANIPPRDLEPKENSIIYRADIPDNDSRQSHHYWRPSIFMPRWASRITLKITDVRCERLQDITEADAIAEGIELDKLTDNGYWKNYEFVTSHPRRGEEVTDEKHRIVGYKSPTASYRSLWEKINGAGSWDLNPWVWVIEFKTVTK